MHTVIFPQQSTFAYVVYFSMMGGLLLTLAAYLSIIRKAGFSGWWILLPGSDALLFVILFTLLFYVPQTYTFGDTTYSGPASLDTYEALSFMTFVLGLASMIAVFVFAFAPWPVEQEAQRLAYRARETSSEALLQRLRPPDTTPTRGPGSTAPGPLATEGAAGAAGAAGTALLTEAPPPDPEPPARFFCSWCGKERQRGAFAIHHCGSRTRPPVYCCTCGADLTAGAACCGRCGTDAATLSPS